MTDAPQQALLRPFLDALREGSIPFDTSVLAKSPIALRNGESLAFVCYEVTLKGPNTVDRGDLVLTTQRYVFLGEKRTLAVELSEIIGVEPYGDAVAIHRTGKEQTEMYGGLDTQEITYTADGQRTLISGLVVACALEGLMTRDRATSRPAPAPVAEADPATVAKLSTADELAKLADLRDRGVLTDEEFARLKAELIG